MGVVSELRSLQSRDVSQLCDTTARTPQEQSRVDLVIRSTLHEMVCAGPR
jgi:hypothetical protein